MLIDEAWDLVINIGHVVPHEVLGFSNHNKNYFIGLGGKETICASHIAAALYGIENNLGSIITPLRACYNWAEDEFLGRLPDVYLQVVMRRDEENRLVHSGVYVGNDLETYLMAARASREQNITVFDKPVDKIVAMMQADEFRATWVANKAIYRTRMAMADGGELLVIAPGVERFGEQPEVDALIRKIRLLRNFPRARAVSHERRHAGNRARDCPSHPRIIRRPIHDSLCPWPPLQSRNGRGPLRLRRLGRNLAALRFRKTQRGLEHAARR